MRNARGIGAIIAGVLCVFAGFYFLAGTAVSIMGLVLFGWMSPRLDAEEIILGVGVWLVTGLSLVILGLMLIFKGPGIRSRGDPPR
jgi:ABC-type uncharacterized transport system permease subunit